MTPKQIAELVERLQHEATMWQTSAKFTEHGKHVIALINEADDTLTQQIELILAAELALHAIDTVLESHKGQAEYSELMTAFSALESALIAKAHKNHDPSSS